MKKYIALDITVAEEKKEALMALLAEENIEGIEEQEGRLKVYLEEEKYDEVVVDAVIDAFDATYTSSEIEEQNWNAVWESNFDPVIVNDFAAVRAYFHAPIDHVKHELIITPKMSFGTGHHATTYMMMEQMESVDFTDKSVFDFGTGSGVLAILASKLGASKILAIDNDQWSVDNTKENALENKVALDIELAETVPSTGSFDIILANINRHVILAHLDQLSNLLAKNGTLFISGILVEDEEVVLTAAAKAGLYPKAAQTRNNWLCIRLSGDK